jgi:hypothetical protein
MRHDRDNTGGGTTAAAHHGDRPWSFRTGGGLFITPVIGGDGTISADPILRDRHQLNSSPALGRTGVYIGSEDGHLWYVPYDYCLHRLDPRCSSTPGEPYAARLSRVFPVTAGGTTKPGGSEGPAPSSAEITGRLMVRKGGKTVYAAMLPAPTAAALVHTRPRFSFHAQLSGDGRYIFITPNSFLKPDTTYHVSVSGRWGADGLREADWTGCRTTARRRS